MFIPKFEEALVGTRKLKFELWQDHMKKIKIMKDVIIQRTIARVSGADVEPIALRSMMKELL